MLVLGKFIDGFFPNRQIGYYETLEQVVNGVKIIIHCQKEEIYRTKIMSCHDTLNCIEDYETLQSVTST